MAMRPGGSPERSNGTVASHWSRPKLVRVMYSARLAPLTSRAMVPAAATIAGAAPECFAGLIRARAANASRARQRAVFGFMVAYWGTTEVRMGICHHQPMRSAQQKSTTRDESARTSGL